MNPRAKRSLFFLAKTVLSVGLLYWLLSGGMLGRVIAETRDRFHPIPFAIGLLSFAVSNILGGCQWNLLLRAQGIRIGWRKAISLYYVGLFFSNFLPANIGGDVIKVVDVYRSTGRGGGAVAATMVDRAAGLAVLTILAAVAVVPTLSVLGREPFLILVPVLLVLFLGAGLMMLSRRVSRLTLRAAGHIPFLWVRKKTESVLTALFLYRDQRGALFRALAIALPVQTLRIGVHYLAARSIGIEAPAVYFFLFIPLIAVFIALPISINGLGVRESLGVYLYARIGIPQELAFSISFLAYLIGVVVSLLGGGIFLLRSGVPKKAGSVPVLQRDDRSR
ncbi:MAG: flippase-like domain-containing protein [Candidatus Eisenbacteria bacterium]|nr:flippase-like domain-containing protein [Candidatus Eisenbacteria bacterium]